MSNAKGKNTLLIFLLAIFLIIAACSGGFLLFQQVQVDNARKELERYSIPDATVPNPIDFSALQSENPDIYAWIYVPDTNINYPILQHPTDNAYYLANNKDHARSIEGAIFTELYNSKDFNDPVTVIYGHNIRGGLMFADLHEFEDVAFFDEHPYFYVYTPGHVLTYSIVAAAGFDDRHILNTQDLNDLAVRSAYFKSLTEVGETQKNARQAPSLDVMSKVVQLSTCNYTFGNERYVVTGVLVDDQRTL